MITSTKNVTSYIRFLNSIIFGSSKTLGQGWQGGGSGGEGFQVF